VGEQLFYAVLLGAGLGVVYDFFRLLRYLFNDKFFFDFLFWIISAICVFCYYLIFNNGAIQILNLLLAFIGFLIYIFTLGYVTKSFEIYASKKIKIGFKKIVKSFKKLLHLIGVIYYNKAEYTRGILANKSKGDDYDKGNKKEK
jgi:hypothetical protein